MIIDGKKIADEIIAELKTAPIPKKYLAVIFVESPSGGGASSESFVRQKEKIAGELGVDFRIYNFPPTITQDDLRKKVGEISAHTTCGGVIVQLPLPDHIDKHYICNAIPREKDVDVLGERALGAFYTGRNKILPPAVGVIQTICAATHCQLIDTKVAVVGLGFLVGKPISVWLMGRAKSLSLLDVGSDVSKDLKEIDLVILGVGKAGIIASDMLKDGAMVIDFGCCFVNGKISGDFDGRKLFDIPQKLAYTPVPGGTGPILVAHLFKNFFTLNT